MEKQKNVKNNCKFEFDKVIYLDLFLNKNMERSNKHRNQMEKSKFELRHLKDEHERLTLSNDIV